MKFKAGLEDMALEPGPAGLPGIGARGRWVLALGLGLACEASRPAEPAVAVAPAKEAAPVVAGPEAAPALAYPLLAWLDPDATSAVYLRGAPELDLVALAELFAVPPRAAHMLRDLQNFEDGLAALIGESGPKPATWLRPEALAYLPPMAHGAYLVRGLGRPRADVEAWLRAAGLAHATIEGMAVYAPLPPTEADPETMPEHLAAAAAFPWRIVFLADDVIGCLSLKEVGGGMGPLTAGRDLPSSQIELQLTREFREDPEMQLDMFASGPMLSLDISDDIAALRLGVRRWSRTGLDGELVLQPIGDADEAAKQLEARAPVVATDALRDLYKRVAFTPESPVVRGRLQLTAEDLRLLRRSESP